MEDSNSNLITYINYINGQLKEGLKKTFASESFHASPFPFPPTVLWAGLTGTIASAYRFGLLQFTYKPTR